MDAKLFTLVSADDPNKVFAWGMEIDSTEETVAVLYRRGAGRYSTGLHPSAEAALRLWSRIAPMQLLWEPTADEVLAELANLAP